MMDINEMEDVTSRLNQAVTTITDTNLQSTIQDALVLLIEMRVELDRVKAERSALRGYRKRAKSAYRDLQNSYNLAVARADRYRDTNNALSAVLDSHEDKIEWLRSKNVALQKSLQRKFQREGSGEESASVIAVDDTEFQIIGQG